jgi:hypothetical protein
MFISTGENRLVNSDQVHFFEVVPYLNEDKAVLSANIGDKSITLFIGTAAETKTAYDDLVYALASNTATFTKFSRIR